MRSFNDSIDLTNAITQVDTVVEARDGIDASDAKWFAVQTKPRAEQKAISFLSLKAIPTFLPRLLVHRRHGSRRWQVLEPLFPSYVFAQFAPDPPLIDKVRWTPGVKKVLGDEEAPIPVPEEAILLLQERVGERGFIVPGLTVYPGIRVRFKNGPLAHLEGIVERSLSRADRVRVLLDLLGRQVPVEVDESGLEPA